MFVRKMAASLLSDGQRMVKHGVLLQTCMRWAFGRFEDCLVLEDRILGIEIRGDCLSGVSSSFTWWTAMTSNLGGVLYISSNTHPTRTYITPIRSMILIIRAP